MATLTSSAPSLTRVAVRPRSEAGEHYRAGRERAALAPGFAAHTGLNLHFFGGKTIQHLTFTHVYLGGKAKWSPDDVARIDSSLPAAMEDRHLNNVLAQYFAAGDVTSVFQPSRILEQPIPAHVYRDTIESLVASLHDANGLSGFDLSTSVFCFMLPRGVVLADGNSPGHQRINDEAIGERDEADDSKHGLGGYHGSIHPQHGTKTDTVYYAVGVYSEGSNGIVAFDEPWKSICATFYHELSEARTDPDIEDAIRAGGTPAADKFVGWYSPKGGEIGDIPMEEAGRDLSTVMQEVPLTHGGTAPIQLMWSNAVGGPEGPITRKHPARLN